MQRKRAVVRDLQLSGCSWSQMIEITGLSNGFIQRNRDPVVSVRLPAVSLVCAFCGKGFQSRQSNVSRKLKKGQSNFYCSKACSGAGRSKGQQVILKCDFCGQTFSRSAGKVATCKRRGGHKMFCSRACANAALVKPYQVQDGALFDYLAGVVCGDGCVVRDKGGKGRVVSISVGFNDSSYVDVLSGVVEQVFGFPPHYTMESGCQIKVCESLRC